MKRNEKEKWNSRRNTLDRRHMIWFFSMFMLTSFFFLPIQFWVNVSKVYVVRTWFPCMTPKKREMRYHLDHNHTNWEKKEKEKWPYKKSHWRKNRSFSRSSFISTASLFPVLSLLPFFRRILLQYLCSLNEDLREGEGMCTFPFFTSLLLPVHETTMKIYDMTFEEE